MHGAHLMYSERPQKCGEQGETIIITFNQAGSQAPDPDALSEANRGARKRHFLLAVFQPRAGLEQCGPLAQVRAIRGIVRA